MSNLTRVLKKWRKREVLSKASDGMADTDKEKFAGLTEDLSFEDKESFEKKVNTIRESYFASKPSKKNVETVVTDEPVQLEEETKKDLTILKSLPMLTCLVEATKIIKSINFKEIKMDRKSLMKNGHRS